MTQPTLSDLAHGQVWTDDDSRAWFVFERADGAALFTPGDDRGYFLDEVCADGDACERLHDNPHAPLTRAQIVKNV